MTTVYDELGPGETDAEWVDDDGDHWRFDDGHWYWLSDDGWAWAVPLACYGPFTERPIIRTSGNTTAKETK